MGNSKSKNTTKTQMKSKQVDMTQSVAMSHEEWLSQIKIKQREYQLKQADEMKNSDINDYELFIQYLTFTTTNIIGYSEISIICRIIRHFVGSCHGVSIFNGENFYFDGLRLSIAIHPITAQIFIADECQIYKLNEENENEKQFEMIAKVPNLKKNKNKSSKLKITDLTWSCDGKYLLCLMNSNLISIRNIIIDDDTISIENRILHKIEYAKMDYLKYDFNHFYFDASYFLQLLNFRDIINDESASITRSHLNATFAHINIRSYSSLYRLDIYKNHLWIIANSIQRDPTLSNIGNELNVWNQPLLFKIPFKWIYLTRELEILYKEINNISQKAMNDVDNNEYEEMDSNGK